MTGDDFIDSFADYLNKPCDKCDQRATHNQGGLRVCNAHLDNSPQAVPAFARND